MSYLDYSQIDCITVLTRKGLKNFKFIYDMGQMFVGEERYKLTLMQTGLNLNHNTGQVFQSFDRSLAFLLYVSNQ